LEVERGHAAGSGSGSSGGRESATFWARLNFLMASIGDRREQVDEVAVGVAEQDGAFRGQVSFAAVSLSDVLRDLGVSLD
jgi:hypothetical protein